MNKRIGLLGRLAVLLALQFLATSALAQATRTWVSGVGDDVNPCSRTAPCKTFAGAISKTAAKGEISVLDPAGYGAFTINKAITINGGGNIAGVLTSGGNGINITAGANDVVVLKNLSLEGLGLATSGIKFNSGAELHIENLTIAGFASQGIHFTPSGASQLFVKDTGIINNSGGGVHVQPGPSGFAVVALERVTINGNLRGIGAEDACSVMIKNSSISGNDINGVVAAATSRSVDLSLENSVASYNGSTGVYSGQLATIRILNNLVSRNLFGLTTVDGGQIITHGGNRIWGNSSGDGSPTSSAGPI